MTTTARTNGVITITPHTDLAALPATALLTEEEVAAHLGMATPSMRTWRQRNRGPRWFHLGQQVRYRVGDLISWLDEQYEQR